MELAVSELVVGLLLAMAAQTDPSSSVTLGDIEARLYYKETGRLSDNVLSRGKEFLFHNTIIGEGDAEEYADDLLIAVPLSTGKLGDPLASHKFIDSPVEIVARDASGKVLGRRVHKDVLTSYRGTEYKVLWLNDVTCAGDVTVTASYAGQKKSVKLEMGCGE